MCSVELQLWNRELHRRLDGVLVGVGGRPLRKMDGDPTRVKDASKGEGVKL